MMRNWINSPFISWPSARGRAWPSSWRAATSEYDSVSKWMNIEVGFEDEDWIYHWGLGCMYFKNEEDRVKFILRWL